MRRLAALLTVTALLLLALPVLATGDYPTPTTAPNDPCDEYHETRHPECQTTTTYQTTTTSEATTTTQPEVTTTTSNNTTTTNFVEQTTTTAAPCAPGLIHQPPLCVDPSTTVPVFDTTTTPTEPLEVLPFTGPLPGNMTAYLALTGSLSLVLGLLALMFVRREMS